MRKDKVLARICEPPRLNKPGKVHTHKLACFESEVVVARERFEERTEERMEERTEDDQ
jgi:hypothetical protein